MASYLLLHGAWHAAWCWEPVRTILAAAGHQVAAPDLPGLSPNTVQVAGSFGLGDHIEAASAALDDLAGEIILVAHSYAGMLARALEDQCPGRLGHVVLIEALQPEPGQSVLDLVPDGGSSFLSNVRDTLQGPVLLPPDVVRFAIPDPDMARQIAARLLPHPFRTFTEPLPPTVMATQAIGRTYVYASDRNPNPYQHFIDRLRTDLACRLIAMTGGHELMLTQPARVADLLEETATDRVAIRRELIST